jgi:hypothetical protein
MFFRGGLDDPNHLDLKGEFFLKAHAGGLAEMSTGAFRAHHRDIVAATRAKSASDGAELHRGARRYSA